MDEFIFSPTDTESEFEGFTNIEVMKTQRMNYYRREVRGQPVVRSWETKLTDTGRFIHPFHGPRPGPTHRIGGQGREIDYFWQIFDPGLVAFITRQTNRYAKERRRQRPSELREKWEPATVPEMKAFLGVLLLFGCVWQPEIDLYWAKSGGIFGHEIVRKTFPRHRFRLLLRYFYYCNQRYCKPGTPQYSSQKKAEKVDRMLKLRTVIERVNTNSQNMRNPTCELSIDEGVIPFRGRSKNVTYNPAKPHKYGIRVYMLSEPSTGYVFNDEIHQHFDGDMHPLDYRNPDSDRVFLGNKPGKVVNRLMSQFLRLGHHVVMDSYYTSVPLFDHLYYHDTVATGTCKKTTPGLPQTMKDPHEQVPLSTPSEQQNTRERWPRGSFTTIQNDNLIVSAWKDCKMVRFMSTGVNARHRQGPGVTRRSKDRITGNYRRVTVTCPRVAVVYNKFFKGVDLSDQMMSYYHPGRTSPRWHRCVFYHQLNKALVNAFVNWATVNNIRSDKCRRQLKFRATIAEQLIGNYTGRKQPIRAATLPGRPRRHTLERDIEGRRRRCYMCRTHGRRTATGKVPETRMTCTACHVPICNPNNRAECWEGHNV